jgi:general secretion pathway protein I
VNFSDPGIEVERVAPDALQALGLRTSVLGATRSTFEGPRKRTKAFTLIEVLVSLGIFALAAVVLGTAYINILANYHAMRAWTVDKEEMAFARATLLAEPDRKKAEEGGEVALLAGGKLRWNAAIDEMPRADLFRVTLDMEITPPPPQGVRREQQVFLLLRPTWSDPAQREKLRAAFREQLALRKF